MVNARLAGYLYVVILVFGLLNEVVRSFLVVPDDPATTAENLLASEWLFRVVFAANVVYILGEVIVTIILYRLFAPVHRTVSMLAAALRFISLAIFGINLLNMFAALLILRETDYVNEPKKLALLFLELQRYGYNIGLTFFGVNCLAMGYLLAKSSHAPKPLGILLGIAGIGYLTNSFQFFLLPGYNGSLTPLLLAPALVAETWLCVLLLRKGGGVREWNELEHARET